VLQKFGVCTDQWKTNCGFPFVSPQNIHVEGDWSNGAFFLAAQALGNPVSVTGLLSNSLQGDCSAAKWLTALNDNCCIDASDIPDLVPILAVVAGAKKGATFTNIARLRLKESDRVATTSALLTELGASTTITSDTLTVIPGRYRGCIVDAAGDHRIAMSAAIAASIADGPVTILCAQCVSKSYPGFWQEYQKLGGKYVQYVW
jgi:3-phosphoshikimate 1-carboxyvinyltransferase